MKKAKKHEEFIRIAQAAKLLDVHYLTLRKSILDGTILIPYIQGDVEAIRLTDVLFNKKDLEDYIPKKPWRRKNVKPRKPRASIKGSC